MTNWDFYDLTTLVGKLEVVTYEGGLKWFGHLLAGEVKCLICGEQCTPVGEHSLSFTRKDAQPSAQAKASAAAPSAPYKTKQPEDDGI